jgi:Flp pilus assembly pilin Flp
MRRHVQTITRRAAVGAQLAVADAGDRVAAAWSRTGPADEDGERGAQAAEYAMLGGVSAAACTGLVALFKNRSTLKTLVEAVLGTLGKVVEGWF